MLRRLEEPSRGAGRTVPRPRQPHPPNTDSVKEQHLHHSFQIDTTLPRGHTHAPMPVQRWRTRTFLPKSPCGPTWVRFCSWSSAYHSAAWPRRGSCGVGPCITTCCSPSSWLCHFPGVSFDLSPRESTKRLARANSWPETSSTSDAGSTSGGR